uniref:Secreted protein n=1 Tax=Ascaris lumbricoides TaxID=6252 RepID=A0A0M3IW39_ASCLU
MASALKVLFSCNRSTSSTFHFCARSLSHAPKVHRFDLSLFLNESIMRVANYRVQSCWRLGSILAQMSHYGLAVL